MKKYYGPIVLGIAALTVAAPIVNTTTVLAGTDDATVEKDTIPSESAGDEAGSKQTSTEKLQAAIDGLDSKITDTKTYNTDQIEALKSLKATYTDSSNKATNDDKREELITRLGNDTANISTIASLATLKSNYQSKLSDFENALNKFNGSTPIVEKAKEYVSAQKQNPSDKLIKLSDYDDLNSKLEKEKENLDTNVTSNSISTNVKDANDKSTKITVSNVPMEKDEETTNIDISKDNKDLTGSLTIDKDGKTITAAAPLTVDNSKTTINTTTDTGIKASKDEIQAAKNKIKTNLDSLKPFTSSNQPALDAIRSELTKYSNGLDSANPLTSQQVTELENQANKYFNQNTATISLINNGKQERQNGVPIIKDATVYMPNYTGTNHDEYLALNFDKDGKLVSSTITDKDHNKIRTNTIVKSWIGTQADNAVTNQNDKPINNHSNHHNNNSTNTTKPETKPEQTKSIKSQQATFYALPNKITSLYNENGQVLKDRALSGNSSWLSDKLMTLDGVNYLRVATNEWAKLADGLEVNPLSENIYTKNEARLYTANGDIVRSRALAGNTAWRTDKSATINGQTMYRVATNEWVSSADLK